MGISASQGKLLFMTARISNNEFQQQSIAFSKEHLSDRADRVNDLYNDALSATKYQILTGFNGVDANYEDLTYSMLTSYNSASNGRQYIVKDNKGKVLVSNAIAKAFRNNNGDFNKFLEAMGYTQVNVDMEDTDKSEEAIHNAWDKYLVSVGQSIDSMGDLDTHILGFGFEGGYPTYKSAIATSNINGDVKTESLYKDNEGYYTNRATIAAYKETDENGKEYYYAGFVTDKNQKTPTKLDNVTYDSKTGKFGYNGENYAVLYVNPKNTQKISDTQKDHLRLLDKSASTYVSDDGIKYDVSAKSHAINYEGTTQSQRELYDYAFALSDAQANGVDAGLTSDAAMVDYYKNIFNEMLSCGYTTLSGKIEDDESNVKEKDFKDTKWFVNQLKSGNLRISYYSTTSKSFVGTTLDDDSAIVEKEDKTKIAQAEQEYNTQMDKIEHDEKMFDMQLNKLEAEHQALTTELESINKVIQENIKNSFKTFGNA